MSSFLGDGIGPNYAPDGLDEAAIDALMAEVLVEVDAEPARLARLSADESERRRERRAVNRRLRLLADNLLVGGLPGQGKSRAVRQIVAMPFDPDGKAA